MQSMMNRYGTILEGWIRKMLGRVWLWPMVALVPLLSPVTCSRLLKELSSRDPISCQ